MRAALFKVHEKLFWISLRILDMAHGVLCVYLKMDGMILGRSNLYLAAGRPERIIFQCSQRNMIVGHTFFLYGREESVHGMHAYAGERGGTSPQSVVTAYFVHVRDHGYKFTG